MTLTLPSLADLQADLARRGVDPLPDPHAGYQTDPVGFIGSVLGEYAWSKQREIANALVTHRKVAVKSCHSSGKSWLAGRLAVWFIASFPPRQARVMTTAPTGSQVKGVLWQEIHAAASKASLPGRINQTEWWIGDYMAAMGRKPMDTDMAAFQGFHAPHLLVIFDEADGMPRPLWHAADSLLASGDGYWLAIGNPYDPTSEFAEVCKPGSGWHTVSIPAWDTPNLSGEDVPDQVKRVTLQPAWVEDKRRKWGNTNPLWLSKIEAEFPEQAEDTLIPVRWVRDAQDRTLPADGVHELGVDVGGGGDKTVIAERKGARVRVLEETQEPDTMVSAARVVERWRQTRATTIKVDEIGIGAGVVDRLRELGAPVKGVNVARRALDPTQFSNLRAEGYWTLRDLFQEGLIDIDPDDDDLAAQLVNLKWKRRTNGVQIEPKDQIRGRGLPSPDRADAVMLSYIVPSRDFGLDNFASLSDW